MTFSSKLRIISAQVVHGIIAAILFSGGCGITPNAHAAPVEPQGVQLSAVASVEASAYANPPTQFGLDQLSLIEPIDEGLPAYFGLTAISSTATSASSAFAYSSHFATLSDLFGTFASSNSFSLAAEMRTGLFDANGGSAGKGQGGYFEYLFNAEPNSSLAIEHAMEKTADGFALYAGVYLDSVPVGPEYSVHKLAGGPHRLTVTLPTSGAQIAPLMHFADERTSLAGSARMGVRWGFAEPGMTPTLPGESPFTPLYFGPVDSRIQGLRGDGGRFGPDEGIPEFSDADFRPMEADEPVEVTGAFLTSPTPSDSSLLYMSYRKPQSAATASTANSTADGGFELRGNAVAPDDRGHRIRSYGASILAVDFTSGYGDAISLELQFDGHSVTIPADGSFDFRSISPQGINAFKIFPLCGAELPDEFLFGLQFPPNLLASVYASIAVAPTPGDFDSDGDVDGADFVAWQTNFPKTSNATLAEGDADGDGNVDGTDFVIWQSNFLTSPNSGATNVPEPAAAFMALCGILLLAGRNLRHHSV